MSVRSDVRSPHHPNALTMEGVKPYGKFITFDRVAHTSSEGTFASGPYTDGAGSPTVNIDFGGVDSPCPLSYLGIVPIVGDGSQRDDWAQRFVTVDAEYGHIPPIWN